MRWSSSYLFTAKEAPSDAEIPSHKLMARSGLVKKVAPGIYTYGNLALRAIRKFEKIIREELDSRGCQEILMPMVQPASLWQETKRWEKMGDGLLKFKNRNEHDFCLGATHEEVVTDYVRKDVRSYRDLPFNLYQIQTKYRDEIRPRFGLMRGREFIMKDAYSFDRDREGALKAYDIMYKAYEAIFRRLGANFRIVQADPGQIGGSQTHEFQVLADAGEDHLMVCSHCDFAANIEVAPSLTSTTGSGAAPLPKEEFATPGLKKIKTLSEALKIPEKELVKTLFYSTQEDPKSKELKPVCVLLRGSDEANPVKLKNTLGMSNPPLMLTDEEVKQVSGAWPGSCGPVGLNFPVVMDEALSQFVNFIVGANKDGFHLKNVNIGRDFKPEKIADLKLASVGDQCPKCKTGTYQSFRGIEVGHVFYLGTLYSQMMEAQFVDAEGQLKPIEMGCYGIGVSRTVQAVIEQSHDADGIIWPPAIAPFPVHICLLDPTDSKASEVCGLISNELTMRGLEPLVDDREERPGVKFKDADLLGMPVRINIGAKGLANGEVEIVVRRSKTMSKVKVADVVDSIEKALHELTPHPTV